MVIIRQGMKFPCMLPFRMLLPLAFYLLACTPLVAASPSAQPSASDPLVDYVIIAALAVGAFAIAAVAIMRRHPPNKSQLLSMKPAALRLTPLQKEVQADAKSSIAIAVELLDGNGMPAVADRDIYLSMTATGGKIIPNITLPKGTKLQQITITSSDRVGMVKVAVSAIGLLGAETNVYFTEKKNAP